MYRLGDTVQFKIYVRDQSNEKFVPAPSIGYTLQVYDPMDKLAHEATDIVLDGFGGYSGEFLLPDTAAVGWYSFRLTADFIEHTTWYPLRVLVADFTPDDFNMMANAGQAEAEAQLATNEEMVRIIRERDWPDGTCPRCGATVTAIGPVQATYDDERWLVVVYEHCGEQRHTDLASMP